MVDDPEGSGGIGLSGRSARKGNALKSASNYDSRIRIAYDFADRFSEKHPTLGLLTGVGLYKRLSGKKGGQRRR